MTKTRTTLYTELSQAEPGRPFDGLAAGTFTDMYGRSVTVRKEDLAGYLANTQRLLESTRDSAGQIVGIPIDTMNHNHSEAAGWIVGVAMGERGDVLTFTPRWNPLGMELINNDVMRFFSATFDPGNKVVMGGSLTNWPSTRSQKGDKIMLRPLELSTQMYELDDESINGKLHRIGRAFFDRFWNDNEVEWWSLAILEYYDDYLIVESAEKYYKVSYSETDEGVEFPAVADWTEVKISYIEAALRSLKRELSRLFVRGQKGSDEPNPEPGQPIEGATMPEPVVQPTELAALLPADPEMAKKLNELINQRVQAELSAQLDAEKRKAHVAEFVARVTAGARALPVESAELTAFMASLSVEQQDAAEKLFDKIAETGIIDFEEKGHGNTLTGAQPLPEWAKPLLSEWIAGGGKIAEFFAVNASELGNQADYNLAEFKEKES